MNPALRICFGVLLFAPLMVSFGEPSQAPYAVSIPIEYFLADVPGAGRQQVALLVGAQIDGYECRMQLDTGVNGAVIWKSGSLVASDAATGLVTVRVGSLTRMVPAGGELRASLSRCSEVPSIGTLGNAFFEQGSLRLDLAKPALSYIPGPALVKDIDAMPLRYARWSRTGGHPLVEVHSEDGKSGSALLDTGSVPVELAVLSLQDWNVATNSLPLAPSAKVRRREVQSWGHSLICYLAEADIQWTIGQGQTRALSVLYCPLQQSFRPPEPLLGVLGMRAFGTSTLTLDYVSERWRVDPPTNATPFAQR